MSESPKMGLLGSKDKDKESKTDSSAKDTSPGNYPPYCIDSDSETYDTEALSMMDINDIIGVQSEAVSDSTLESEIAALSQMITDSKGESSQKDSNDSKIQSDNSANKNSGLNRNITDAGAEQNDGSSCKNTFNVVEDLASMNTLQGQMYGNDSELNSNNDVDFDTSQLPECSKTYLSSSDTRLNKECEPGPGSCLETDNRPVVYAQNKSEVASMEISADSTISQNAAISSENIDVTSEIPDESLGDPMCTKAQEAPIKAREETVTDVVKVANAEADMEEHKEDSAEDSMLDPLQASNKPQEDKDVKSNVSSLSKSLQLIGEAYTSDDSQDSEDQPTTSSETVIREPKAEANERVVDAKKHLRNKSNVTLLKDHSIEKVEIDSSHVSVTISQNVQSESEIAESKEEQQNDDSDSILLQQNEQVKEDTEQTSNLPIELKAEVRQLEDQSSLQNEQRDKTGVTAKEANSNDEIAMNQDLHDTVECKAAINDSVLEKKSEELKDDKVKDQEKEEPTPRSEEKDNELVEIQASVEMESTLQQENLKHLNDKEKCEEAKLSQVKRNNPSDELETKNLPKSQSGEHILPEMDLENKFSDIEKGSIESSEQVLVVKEKVKEMVEDETTEHLIKTPSPKKEDTVGEVNEISEDTNPDNVESDKLFHTAEDGPPVNESKVANSPTLSVTENKQAVENVALSDEDSISNTLKDKSDTIANKEFSSDSLNNEEINPERTPTLSTSTSPVTETLFKPDTTEISNGTSEESKSSQIELQTEPKIKDVDDELIHDKIPQEVDLNEDKDLKKVDDTPSEVTASSIQVEEFESNKEDNSAGIQENSEDAFTNLLANIMSETNAMTSSDNIFESIDSPSEFLNKVKSAEVNSEIAAEQSGDLNATSSEQPDNVNKSSGIDSTFEGAICKDKADSLDRPVENDEQLTSSRDNVDSKENTSGMSDENSKLLESTINVASIKEDTACPDRSSNISKLPSSSSAITVSERETKSLDVLKESSELISVALKITDSGKDANSSSEPNVNNKILTSNHDIPVSEENVDSSCKSNTSNMFSSPALNVSTSEEGAETLSETSENNRLLTSSVNIVNPEESRKCSNKADTNSELQNSAVEMAVSEEQVDFMVKPSESNHNSEKNADSSKRPNKTEFLNSDLNLAISNEAVESLKQAEANEESFLNTNETTQADGAKASFQDIEKEQNSEDVQYDRNEFSDIFEDITEKELCAEELEATEIEEETQEDMNLTLDPEDSELQSEAFDLGNENTTPKVKDAEEETEDQVEINLSLDPEDKVDDILVDVQGVAKASSPKCQDDIDMALLEKKGKILEKQSEADEEVEDNLKNILEIAEGVAGMFSDDQSQGTQDIVTSILNSVDDVAGLLTENQPSEKITGLENILDTVAEEEVEKAFADPTGSPLVEATIESLTHKLPVESEESICKELEDPMTAQNMDSLEGLLGLDLMAEGEGSVLKEVEREVEKIVEETQKDIQPIEKASVLLGETNRGSNILKDEDYITDVISGCLSSTNSAELDDNTAKTEVTKILNDESEDAKAARLLEVGEELANEAKIKDEASFVVGETLGTDEPNLTDDLETMAFELASGNETSPLDTSAVLGDESKIEIPQDLLLEDADQNEALNDIPLGIESSHPNSEISEIESAVKFLQESEEQAIDSPLLLSPKMVNSVVDMSAADDSLFVPEEDICDDAAELAAELSESSADPIAISEAEIISEAAKLESERKAKLTAELKVSQSLSKAADDLQRAEEEPSFMTSSNDALITKKSEKDSRGKSVTSSEVLSHLTGVSKSIRKTSEPIPKVSILEERLKEPPKIEIPVPEALKLSDTLTTTKTSLLIEKDAKMAAFQKMLESPKSSERAELKLVDTPRKDSEKHDFENVGSPRIILKIAKSAIADCGEPRSPRSPKIRSAANSPNPEDSPGQKLGKIKLKLSKGGHPSIISNENVEDTGQWHAEDTSSASPIGMKIKLSKSGDASIIQSDKHESSEEVKRIECPIGMKIKLSKTGDASIVQQDLKEVMYKHKDKHDSLQETQRRMDSPIGMKIKLSKTGDASIIQPEKHDLGEEHKEGMSKSKDKLDIIQDIPKRIDSPLGMKIKLSKTGDASIIPSDLSEEGKEAVSKAKDKLESAQEAPKRTDSPIGMKIKLSKTRGGASIIQTDDSEDHKDRLEVPEAPKRTESPLGMKIKLSKTGDASIVHRDIPEDFKEAGQKSKDKDESLKNKDKSEASQQSETIKGVKIKVTKGREASIVMVESSEISETNQTSKSDTAKDALKKSESPIGMKIKLSKSGDASIVHSDKETDESKIKEKLELPQETIRKTESPLGMKIKFSKTGDASIVQSEPSEESAQPAQTSEMESSKGMESCLGVKIKLSKSGDASIVEPEKSEKKEKAARQRKDTDPSLEMKIKLSKTGHPTIIPGDASAEGSSSQKGKDSSENTHGSAQKHKDVEPGKEPALKIMKTGHPTLVQSSRAELTIEPIHLQSRKHESGGANISPKRKEVTISPVESKKSKLEAKLSQILPEVTIQPVMMRDSKQMIFDPKTSVISRQQMSVISQEISITQVRPSKSKDQSMSDKLKDILGKNRAMSPVGSDCEIIEHRPELIIVNENSNSSQDVMIIEEVQPIRMPEIKIPRKRGRPRRNPLPPQMMQPIQEMIIPRDPLALDDLPQVVHAVEHRENERPRRTCRIQKSYAPPKRGRGRGRGKRKMDKVEMPDEKKARIEQDLTAIENSTMALITLEESSTQVEKIKKSSKSMLIEKAKKSAKSIQAEKVRKLSEMIQVEKGKKSSELYKALKQPAMDRNSTSVSSRGEKQVARKELGKNLDPHKATILDPRSSAQLDTSNLKGPIASQQLAELISINDKSVIGVNREGKEEDEKAEIVIIEEKSGSKLEEKKTTDGKEAVIVPVHQNWLTPLSKKHSTDMDKQKEPTRNESISTVQVIDEETRMSAESGSRSQTPARNLSALASETIINEESQGSVLSTATTESEKVKIKNRRMEINFDPDEGPFTVDKIAEYEWPLDRKGETFMIQEQISQYLGVKSFKRKYPDLKRRIVDMEERSYLRENGLVSEAMCDMGLTAVCSSEVLDIMCSDFPDQYEEYRKHMREKQAKEHSKKQKELTAAANAERNRIDLAEMAVQSAMSWNVNFNKARKESRKCSLDLQTFTIHVPKKQQKVEEDRKVSHYPVALIPGQYTDYYREYTPAELRYYPLNTVLYGPMRPNERKFDSQSDGSQSDSDSDSSSDDSSSSSSEGTQDTEESQSTMDEVDIEMVAQKEELKNVKCKMCLKTLNKHSKSEILIQCGTCNGNVHPSCIDLTLDMVPHIQAYAWQCTDCKTCAQCHDPADEDKMLFCDMCDRGYHIYCVGLRRVPQGRWHCQECAVCANCGSREAGGATSDRNSVAQWQHEYKKGEKNTKIYVSTLCVPCSKLWRKGRYCPYCSRCYSATRLDLEPNLVHCSACDKYLHLGCVETKGTVIDKKNYLCDFCAPSRQQPTKPLTPKTTKT